MSYVWSLAKFERRCEFSTMRWTHDRCPKINKSPTVSFILWDLKCKFGSVAYCGHPNKHTELHLWRFKLEILHRRLPRRPPKTWHSDVDISDLGFFFLCFYFWVKKSKPVGYTRTLYSQTGKNTKWAETFDSCLLLIFKVVRRDHLTQLLPFAWDFVVKRQRLVWGQVG